MFGDPFRWKERVENMKMMREMTCFALVAAILMLLGGGDADIL